MGRATLLDKTSILIRIFGEPSSNDICIRHIRRYRNPALCYFIRKVERKSYVISFTGEEDFKVIGSKQWDWFGENVMMVRHWFSGIDTFEDTLDTIPQKLTLINIPDFLGSTEAISRISNTLGFPIEGQHLRGSSLKVSVAINTSFKTPHQSPTKQEMEQQGSIYPTSGSLTTPKCLTALNALGTNPSIVAVRPHTQLRGRITFPKHRTHLCWRATPVSFQQGSKGGKRSTIQISEETRKAMSEQGQGK